MSEDIQPFRGIPAHLLQQNESGNLAYAVNAYLQPAIGQMEQRRMKWLDEYQKWSRESMFKRLEEMSNPAPMMDYLRYCYGIKIAIPPVGLRPFLAEGTRPPSALLSLHRSIVRCQRVERRIIDARNARKRQRRQHRAAFRRRKRGLA